MSAASITSERWEVPEAVEPPTLGRLRAAWRAVNRATGMTAAGWTCSGVGVSCLVAGFVLGWTELKVAGVMAVTVMLVALLFTIGRPRLEVRLAVPERSVVVGTPTRGNLLVRNVATRRHWGSRMDLPVGRERATLPVPALPAGASIADAFRIPTDRRGLVRIGPTRSVQGDPFGLTGRETMWTDVHELHVHPRTVRLPGRQTGFIHDLEGHASSHLTSADMNFHALRPYAPGDDRRHVHWRSTARAGQLMVRQFEESRMSRVVVGLDTGRQAWLDDDEFELGVSCAGSLAVQTLLGDSPLALLTSRDSLPGTTPSRALDGLCVVEQTARGGIVDLVRTARRRAADSSIAMLVTGSMASLTEVRQACSMFDVDTRVVGVRVETNAVLRARTAGNVTVVQVGGLDDLPRAMRRAMA